MASTRVAQSRMRQAWRGWLSWVFVIGAVSLASAGGMVISRAWAAHRLYDVWMAGLMVATATLMAVEGMQKQQISRQPPRLARPAASAEAVESALPRIGEILLHKYHLITEEDLKRALETQATTGQRLGEVLVEMKKLSWFDLAMALEDQLSYGGPVKVA